ncbi:MAG TPA: response regulator [Pyrinomonadaceae bacterium]|jgi:signal transduction histidine kinase
MEKREIDTVPYILILEDTDADAELIEYELRRANIDFRSKRVANKEDFRAEIVNQQPDVVLSDFSLPQFSGLEALRLLKELQCDSPFVLVTGSQTEEVAVECMKEGATDYILKSNLIRLPSAVQNALKRRQVEKERARALEALKASEAQLLQSQKLEAVGRLAGGISHDFNNLLTAIIGYSDLSIRRVSPDDPLRRNLDEIRRASERAAGLTRQLLAFSRKQVMQPKVFELNAVVADVERMLRRMIGDDIDVRTNLDPNSGNVKADPGQIEQVIMNLVVNARDAMPKGGKLSIETSSLYLDEQYSFEHVSVKPGFYVLLAVSDTGTGMDEETRQHIFEPFFTTKEPGKGTGLGLSTVYGIVKQSSGHVWVYSEPGKGTTFKVYLPRVEEGAQYYREQEPAAEVPRGTETILLVEDAEMVRNLTREVLENCGYDVIEASNGKRALSICKNRTEPIDLLLTDVVMPEMSGRELADRLVGLHPEMQVLYMSGYTQDAIVHRGTLDEGTNFIQKPFSPDALARKVRIVLDLENL